MSISVKCKNLIKIANELERRQHFRSKKASAVINERIPLVVDNLIANRIIAPETKQAMLESLKDHGKCLVFIDKLASSVRNNFGRPVAGNTVTKDPGMVNYKKAEDERESGRVFRELLFGN